MENGVLHEYIYIHLYIYTYCRLGDELVQTLYFQIAKLRCGKVWFTMRIIQLFTYEVVRGIFIISVAF